MCGIAGIIGEIENSAGTIKRMSDKLRHRGPDDEGYILYDQKKNKVYNSVGEDSVLGSDVFLRNILSFSSRKFKVVFGHRRLSILDLSWRGHQPMGTPDGKIWIVFNGEIYNYVELREELKSEGFSFSTGTDTEVILKAYEAWGFECVSKFNGMWAFAILDLRKNIVFISRDRAGVKPLYYFFNGKIFAFASEIKALLEIPIKREVNDKILWDFMVLSMVNHSDETFFRYIFEVPRAHNIFIDFLGESPKITIKKYWHVDPNADFSCGKKDKEKYVEKFRELFFEAVRLRLRSDVPVGSCLSGGIDSSSVVCAVNSILREEKIPQIGEKQKTFTLSFPDEKIDESKYAKAVIQKCKVDAHFTSPDYKELIKDMKKVVYAQEEPFLSTSIYGQFKVMELARNSGVKVLLDGQGADELLGGYINVLPSFFMNALTKNPIIFWNVFLKRITYFGNSVSYLIVQFARYFLMSRSTVRKLFHFLPENLLHTLLPHTKFVSPDFISEYYKERFWHIIDEYLKNLLNFNFFLRDIFTRFSLPHLIRYEDKNSMFFSIEARTPFSDDVNLVQFCFSLPVVMKINEEGWTKFVLRESMRGVLPDEVRLRRDKIAFQTPQEKWMGKLLFEMSDFILSNSPANAFVNLKYIQKLLKSGYNSDSVPQHISFGIWLVLNLKMWHDVFFSS